VSGATDTTIPVDDAERKTTAIAVDIAVSTDTTVKATHAASGRAGAGRRPPNRGAPRPHGRPAAAPGIGQEGCDHASTVPLPGRANQWRRSGEAIARYR
jgi:hypothetical protein